jgi:hypothetical protein
MPIGGKLCSSHRRGSEELDPAVINFLVPAFRVFNRSLCDHIPRRISTLHRNQDGNKRYEDIPFCVVSYREKSHGTCSNSKQRLWQGIRGAEST